MSWSMQPNAGDLKRIVNRLERISNGVPEVLPQAMAEALYYVHGQVPGYPEPPFGSTYTRTGTTGRTIGTEVRSIGSETVGVIGTSTVYAPWVISDEDVAGRGPQASVHQGRWWTLQGVVRKSIAGVILIFREAIRNLTKD